MRKVNNQIFRRLMKRYRKHFKKHQWKYYGAGALGVTYPLTWLHGVKSGVNVSNYRPSTQKRFDKVDRDMRKLLQNRQYKP